MASLNIKNEEAHKIATEIAKATGDSITTVVLDALREKRRTLKEVDQEKVKLLMSYGKRYAAQRESSCSGAEAMDALYDEYGLPK